MGTNMMALIQRCQIQAIMTVPQRLSFSAQLSNCNLATSGFATKTIPQGAPMGRGLLSMGKQSIRKSCRCPATRCYKSLELLGWDPHPRPPPNEHNRFQYTVTSHIKSCTGRGVRGKKPGFLERKAYGKETPNSISKASMHDCGMGI